MTEPNCVREAKTYMNRKYRRGRNFTEVHGVSDYFCVHYGTRESEVFVCVFLDNKHRLIERKEMFFGTIAGCSVYPREVVKAALACNAGAVIFCHNHPSGEPEPSDADIAITDRLQEALALVDVRVLDHIIIGGGTYVSFASRGLL